MAYDRVQRLFCFARGSFDHLSSFDRSFICSLFLVCYDHVDDVPRHLASPLVRSVSRPLSSLNISHPLLHPTAVYPSSRRGKTNPPVFLPTNPPLSTPTPGSVVENSCVICVDGVTFNGEFEDDEGVTGTCPSAISRIATAFELGSEKCSITFNKLERLCCPTPNENPCNLCPDGITNVATLENLWASSYLPPPTPSPPPLGCTHALTWIPLSSNLNLDMKHALLM